MIVLGNLTATDVIKEVIDLRASYVRVDLWWSDIEPSEDGWDTTNINIYHEFINMAWTEGVGVILILNIKDYWADSNWQKNKYDNDFNGFLSEWREFCTKVASEFGDKVDFYQILNEENHIWTHSKIHKEREPAVHNVASWGLADAEEDDRFKTIVNVICDWDPWWAAHLDYVCEHSDPEAIDIVAIDHYPGTWAWEDHNHWHEIDTLIEIMHRWGKYGAIMETGFSTWASEDAVWGTLPYWHTEDDQEIFIKTALPIIRDKAKAQNVNHPANRIVFACWYELRGSEPYFGVLEGETPDIFKAIQSNFGIFRDDWSCKRGYDNLQRGISHFREFL